MHANDKNTFLSDSTFCPRKLRVFDTIICNKILVCIDGDKTIFEQDAYC